MKPINSPTDVDPRLTKLAEQMFAAYNGQGPNPWKTFDGRDVPRWSEINDQVRGKWIAAAAESVLFAPKLLGAEPRTIEDVARTCHEVNRAYCASLGDYSQPAWESAPEWQRESAVKGVLHALANPQAKPSDSHESWLASKRADGWKYGPVKDPEKKEHPCFVPYDELPAAQKTKDFLFLAVVRALTT